MTTKAAQQRAKAEYDPAELKRLGTLRQQATDTLAEIQEPLKRQVIAAGFANVPQVEVVKATGITRENVRVMWRDAGVPSRR